MKNIDKFRLSRSLAPKNQSITSFAAVCLPNDVQECFKFKKQLVKSGLVCSITLSILCQWMEKSSVVSMPVLAQWANISINFLQTAKKRNKWI